MQHRRSSEFEQMGFQVAFESENVFTRSNVSSSREIACMPVK